MRKLMNRVRKPQPLIKRPETASQLENEVNNEPIHRPDEPQEQDASDSLSLSLEGNLQRIQGIFEEAKDVATRKFKIGTKETVHAFIVFISGLVNQTLVNNNLINPLMNLDVNLDGVDTLALIKESALSVANVKATNPIL